MIIAAPLLWLAGNANYKAGYRQVEKHGSDAWVTEGDGGVSMPSEHLPE